MAKILHLTSTLSTAGAETMLTYIIKADKTNKHLICSIYGGGRYTQELEAAGCKVYQMNFTSPLLIPLAIVKFFFITIKEMPDIIHSYLFLDNLIARIIGKITGRKVLCSKRDSDRWKPWFVDILNTATAGLADATVTNFRDGISELKRNGVSRDKIFYIPNGKNIKEYHIKLPKKVAKKNLGLLKHEIVITFTGRLVWYKGHEYLIKALPIILGNYPETKLLLVGDGKNRKNLEKLAHQIYLNDNIIFLGKRSDIPEVLKATDIFVSPSLRDGMPGVIMEAMASGLPVIATNADGSKDLIKNYENGIFVNIKDSNMLAEKICEIIKNKKLSEKLARNAQQTIAKNFTVEKMVASYNKLYKELSRR